MKLQDFRCTLQIDTLTPGQYIEVLQALDKLNFLDVDLSAPYDPEDLDNTLIDKQKAEAREVVAEVCGVTADMLG